MMNELGRDTKLEPSVDLATEREVDELNKRAGELVNSYPQRALALHQQAYDLAKEHRYARGTANASLGKADFSLRSSQYELALEQAHEALLLLADEDDRRGEAQARHKLGNIYGDMGEYARALEQYEKSLHIFEEIGDKSGQGTSLNSFGGIYIAFGEYSTALEYYIRSLELKEEVGDIAGQGMILNNTGIIYTLLGEYEKALEYYLYSLSICEQLSDRTGEAKTLNNLGYIYNLMGSYTQALARYQASLSIFEEIGDWKEQGNTLTNIGMIHQALGDLSQAEHYFRHSLDMNAQMGESRTLGDALKALGELFLTKGEVAQAVEYLQRALTQAQELQAKSQLSKIHRALATAYEQLGNYQEAYLHYKKYHLLESEVGNEQARQKIKNMEIAREVDSARKEAEIQRLTNVDLAGKNARLEELHREKNEFLGIVAHDMKNPLTSIIMAASLVKRYHDRITNKDLMKQMEKIEQTAERMKEIVGHLLDINAIESGEMHFQRQVVDPGKVAWHVVEDYKQRAALKHIDIQLDYPVRNLQLLTDKKALMAILENLISNAVKYSPPHRQVTVRILRQGTMIRCEVQDEGPGLSTTDQQQLFQKFRRLSARPTGGEDSTGLGLSVVKRMVESLRGRVWCTSELGSGATFIAELPMHNNDAHPKSTGERPSTQAPQD